MTEEQWREVIVKLDELAGMQIGCMQAISAVFACLTPELKANLKTHLPRLDEAMTSVHLNSGFQDRTLQVAQQTYEQLTSRLR
jgi:hypothetical protein